ncbi:VOC family protein [Enterococcus rivorum]|uniref:Glyoxalase n=1 Tax=Enterococcus rivorum TaxID=762845 RepID=A0A1E5KUJ4_9ENTE|nr:VOC family protein [Enterococcus rivorum]MBP2098979.1 putative lactoylglutathione lyase [Enterococcus rivorum]OEH81428.1 glyoxalase [Enterococcus rivorum]
MANMVFINFPVTDLKRATDFYSKLGFKKNEAFSNEDASAMMWDDSIWFMLLRHSFYSVFLKDKEIADTHKTSSALISLSVASVEAVKKFGETALANGGSYHFVDMGIPEDQMYTLEVQDPDGNTIEPVWMAF